MKFIELEAKKRDVFGKKAGRRLKAEKRIPGIIYGKDMESVPLSLNAPDLEKAMNATDTMEIFLKLKVESDVYQVMLKELQTNVVNGNFVHADFLTIKSNQVLDFKVPVEIVGEEECPGTEEGGLLQILRRELDIRCTVNNIPESITVDVSKLEIGDSVHIEDIILGDNLEVDTEINYTVVTVVAPTLEEDEEETEEEGEETSEEESEEVSSEEE
ncbi:MAG: 50S ribosomal protein L25/general stress protein Ctc [Thermodesulfobacteriota bacterium]